MRYKDLNSLFKGICDAIRKKDGTTASISHQDIPARIAGINGDRATQIGGFYAYSGRYFKVNDGVVSNFSEQACVYVEEAFKPFEKPWEIQVKFKTPVSYTHKYSTLLSTNLTRSIQLNTELQSDNTKLLFFGICTSNNEWTYRGYSDYMFENNTWYYIRCIFDGIQYSVHVSTDGLIFEKIITIDYNGQFYQEDNNNLLTFGGARSATGNICDCAIDLKETHIKIVGELWWGNG